MMNPRSAFEAWLDYQARVRGGRVQAHWLPDNRFWYAEGQPEETQIKVFDPTQARVTSLFDIAKVRMALTRVMGREPPYRGLPFDSFVLSQDGSATFFFEGDGYRLSADQESVSRLPKPNYVDLASGAADRAKPRTFLRPQYFGDRPSVPEAISPDGRHFAGIEGFNLSLRSASDGRSETITEDGTADFGWDIESVRKSLGAGLTLVDRTVNPWSPDGLKLFATKFDQRAVGEVTRTHWLRRIDAVETFRITRSGDALAQILPFIVDPLSRRVTPINIPTEDRFLILLGWSSDSSRVFLAQFSRDCHVAEVVAVNAATGDASVLFSERGASFIRIQHDVLLGRSGCTLLPGESGFLWESERTGFKHLYHYGPDGSLIGQITEGDWPVIEVQCVDASKGHVYFMAHHDEARPYDVHLCRISLSGSPVERLTEGPGIHAVQMAPNFEYFIDSRTRPDFPTQSEVRSVSGKRLHSFPAADVRALDALGWRRPEEFCVKAADGETDLWGVIYLPPDLDPTRKYAVLEYIYGGPQISYVNHGWETFPISMSALPQALPQLGFVVVMLDARGTPERSKAFHDVAYKEWRRHVTADHAAALRNLAHERPWMDLERVGVYGHSWGGYFTFACLVDAPELYRAGFSSAPGYDPYDMFIYEPYLGGPPTASNKSAYDDALLYADAPKLQGKLMIAAGSNDLMVWSSAVKMSRALIDAGKDHELVMLPEEGHGFGTSADKYWIQKLVGFFERHVKGATLTASQEPGEEPGA
jgi:dipeptidyl-peptidase-4